MTMTAEEVRYPDIYLEASVPAQRRSPDKNERGENETMSSFERYFAEGGRQKPGGSSNGEGPSASTSGATAKLAAQVKELQVRKCASHLVVNHPPCRPRANKYQQPFFVCFRSARQED